MPTSKHTQAQRTLVLALNSRSLRRITELTKIGKNRLHTLRHNPLDAKLHELLALSSARLLDLRIQAPENPELRRIQAARRTAARS